MGSYFRLARFEDSTPGVSLDFDRPPGPGMLRKFIVITAQHLGFLVNVLRSLQNQGAQHSGITPVDCLLGLKTHGRRQFN